MHRCFLVQCSLRRSLPVPSESRPTLISRVLGGKCVKFGLVGRVVFTVACADKQPTEASAARFNNIPGVEGRNKSANRTMGICFWCSWDGSFASLREGLVSTSKIVGFPRKGEEVHDGEDGHLDTG